MRNLFSKLVIILPLLSIAACQQVPPPNKFDPIRFAGNTPIELDVAAVEIVEEYQPPFKAPNVEHTFPITPANTVKSWAADRLRATGDNKVLRIFITDASVKEKSLQRTEGVKGALTKDQSEEYEGSLKVALKIYGPEKLTPEAEVSVNVTQSKTVREDITPADREQFYYDLTKSMALEYNRVVEGEITKYFSPFIKYTAF